MDLSSLPLWVCEAMPLGGRWISRKTLALFRENAPALLREAEAPAAPRESFGFQRGLVAPAGGSGATAFR